MKKRLRTEVVWSLKFSVVEVVGIEPATSWMPFRRHEFRLACYRLENVGFTPFWTLDKTGYRRKNRLALSYNCRRNMLFGYNFFLPKRQARLHRTEQFCIGIALLNTRSLFQSFTSDLASISILVLSVSSCQRISKPNTYLSSGRSLNPRGSFPPYRFSNLPPGFDELL